jgi:hypothetical protein
MRKQSKSQYPKTMVIIRDCHWSHNTKVNVENRLVERFLRHWTRHMGFQMATLRPSAINSMRKEAVA